MGKFNCLSGIINRQKSNKVIEGSSKKSNSRTLNTLKIRLEEPVKPVGSGELKAASFSESVPSDAKKDSFNAKVAGHDSPVENLLAETAYEGEDEHEDGESLRRDLSDWDLQARITYLEEPTPGTEKANEYDSFDSKLNDESVHTSRKEKEKSIDMIQSGHVSDPGIGKGELWGSPKLKRSCSNLERGEVLKKMADELPFSKNQFSGELQEQPKKLRFPGSPASVTSHCSADRVMLRKHSSSQVLPSRSRRLWWKLFLWSHRNLHKQWAAKPLSKSKSAALNQNGGYTSDTLEPNKAIASSKMLSSESFTGESLNIGHNGKEDDSQRWNDFNGEISGLWPQNQWVAFSMESSPLARVDSWVKNLETETHIPENFDDYDDNSDGGIIFPPSPDNGKSPARDTAQAIRRVDNLSEEILHANSLIESLNSSSTVAHISGIGLKAIPTLSSFCSLRSVNLSNNSIAHITPGSLPKALHTLNLSRNKISTIEGLRELTRLRILDLSYNRISRIGQGLSNCTIIKELYLAGNKISDVEGLHRLLKITVLDLSFNKITTTKALGQLVANYNSLQALNLLGNPIQNNISEDQLRKAICGLLPKLAYLNKQPVKPQRAREVMTDAVAKAALGTSSSRNCRRRAARRVGSGGSSSSVHRGGVNSKHKSSSRSTSRSHHAKTLSSGQASTSRR